MPAAPITHEYDVEISELTRHLHRLELEKGDPELILELEREREVLRALLAGALRLWDLGEESGSLRRQFTVETDEPWDFQAVYSYVYEMAVAIDTGGDHDLFVRSIRAMRPEEQLSAYSDAP